MWERFSSGKDDATGREEEQSCYSTCVCRRVSKHTCEILKFEAMTHAGNLTGDGMQLKTNILKANHGTL